MLHLAAASYICVQPCDLCSQIIGLHGQFLQLIQKNRLIMLQLQVQHVPLCCVHVCNMCLAYFEVHCMHAHAVLC